MTVYKDIWIREKEVSVFKWEKLGFYDCVPREIKGTDWSS
jgi:hypothetical protein